MHSPAALCHRCRHWRRARAESKRGGNLSTTLAWSKESPLLARHGGARIGSAGGLALWRRWPQRHGRAPLDAPFLLVERSLDAPQRSSAKLVQCPASARTALASVTERCTSRWRGCRCAVAPRRPEARASRCCCAPPPRPGACSVHARGVARQVRRCSELAAERRTAQPPQRARTVSVAK